MYSVDDTVKALALAPARHIYSMAIFGSKSGTTWDNDRTYSDTDSLISANIDIGSSSGGLTIGAAYSAKLTLKLMGDVTVNQTDRIIMRVGFYNSDGTKSDKIGLGWFYVDTITRKDKLTTVVAYDKMLRGAKIYKPTALIFPCRASAILDDICGKMGISLRDGVTMPYDPIINEAPTKGKDSDGNTLYYTRREILGYLASIMGGNWFFDAGGHLAFTQFAAVSDTFAAANSTAADISSDAYAVTGITWNINGVPYSRFDDEDAAGMLEFSNPLKVDAKEPIMGAVEQRLVGLTYHGGTIQRQGCGWFELGDIVNAYRKDGTSAPVLITGIGYTISGGAFTEKIYSSALTDSQSNYTSGDVTGQTVPQSVAQDDAVQTAGGLIPLTEYEYLTNLSAKCNGVTYTVEKDDTTGLISKISDSNGNEFEPTINSGISDTAFHNAVLMAVAIVKGFGKTIEPTGIYAEYVPSGIDVANMLWHDSAGSNDMTLYGSPASASGGLKLSGNSNYGKAALDEPHTVYAIFKGCRSTHTWTPVICKGTNNDTGYTCFDVFLNNGYILGTSSGGNLVSNETPADWHVVCITRSDSGNPKMYIDGTLVGEFTANYGANYAGYYTINNAYRGGMFNNAGEFVFKYLSFGSQEHTAGQVAQISQSLMSKYLYKSMCHKNYRDFKMCTSVSMSWEIPKSGLALLIVVHRYDITSISDSNWKLLHKSPAASPDQSYHQWISVYQYNGAMQAGKEYTISVTQSSGQRLWLGLYIFENAKSFAIIDSAVASSSPITPTATSGNERLYVVTNTTVDSSSAISSAVEAIDCDNLDFAYPIDRRLLVAYDYQPELGITPRFSYFNGEDGCTNYVTIDIIT